MTRSLPDKVQTSSLRVYGDDMVIGSEGDDSLFGSEGADRFYLNSLDLKLIGPTSPAARRHRARSSIASLNGGWTPPPAIIPLLVATAFFGAVYMWLKSLAEAPR